MDDIAIPQEPFLSHPEVFVPPLRIHESFLL